MQNASPHLRARQSGHFNNQMVTGTFSSWSLFICYNTTSLLETSCLEFQKGITLVH